MIVGSFAKLRKHPILDSCQDVIYAWENHERAHLS